MSVPARRDGDIIVVSARLDEHLEAFVAKMVESGRYGSEEEVLREGVRLMEDREARLGELDASLARGLADADAGRTRDAEAVFDRLEAKYRAAVRAA